MKFAGASPVAQQLKKKKNTPATQEKHEMWVRALDQDNPLEERLATHSSIFTGKIPWREEFGGPWSMGLQKVKQLKKLPQLRQLSMHACT